jgi:hypothetical protein
MADGSFCGPVRQCLECCCGYSFDSSGDGGGQERMFETLILQRQGSELREERV